MFLHSDIVCLVELREFFEFFVSLIDEEMN